MPSTITVSGSLELRLNNRMRDPRRVEPQTLTVGSDNRYGKSITIPTAAGGTLINLGSELAQPGWCMIENLDDENFVELGLVVSGTFYPFSRIEPGVRTRPFPLGMPIDELFARADTDPVRIDISVYDR